MPEQPSVGAFFCEIQTGLCDWCEETDEDRVVVVGSSYGEMRICKACAEEVIKVLGGHNA